MEYDLSEDRFYANWPDWIRWTLFLPTGLVGCVIISTLFNIAVALFGDGSTNGSLNHGWYNLISTGIMGAAFVGVSAYVAPKKQFEVSIIMLVVLAVILSALWVRQYDLGIYQKTNDLLYYSLHYITAIVAGLIVAFSIKQDVDSHRSKPVQTLIDPTPKHDELALWDDIKANRRNGE